MTERTTRARDARTISIEIDHRTVSCQEGMSVLRAAEVNGVFVPSLCSHKDLSPFGGCRLCVVEIAGMRGYPLACSTIVQEGMKVLTDTTALRDMRREILELILSEHPSSCLVCDEKAGCREHVHTIRKSGVTTGCRYCPNDTQCELQALAEKLGVTEIRYPVYYRGYEAEHDDPFFDRDYNICILCGRCVRMCQEIRGTSVLAFKYRGPKTQVGPAFGRSHVEAGCEFCGACVSVCPTGTLADKVSKWDGPADGSVVSTCPFCALGCQIELLHKDGRLSRVHPHADPEINDGQLCVRGRFCLPETTHNHERARKPMLKRGRYFREVGWAEAIDEVTSRLAAIGPDDILMLVSPDLTNESLYAAQKFMRCTLKSNGIDSTARWALPGGPALWSQLFSLPISIADIGRADSIVAVGLDSRFSFSVVGVEIRRALREGASLVTIDPRDSNLARYTKNWLRPPPGKEGAVLQALLGALLAPSNEDRDGADAAGVSRQEIDKAVDVLAPGRNLAVVVGPSAFAVDANHDLAAALLRLAGREGTTIVPLFHGANTRGALELGAFGELTAGLDEASNRGASLADLLAGRVKPKILYLVGEAPFVERPDCDYVIAQDIYRPPFEVDVFLPAASFAEAEGTLTNIEGRVQRLARVEALPDGASTGYMRPDWFIFGALGEKLGDRAAAFHDAGEILKEISDRVIGFPATADRQRRPLDRAMSVAVPVPKSGVGGVNKTPAAGGRSPDVGRRTSDQLVLEPGAFRHRGIDMASVVEGLSELALEEGLRVHPDDLEQMGAAAGETVIINVDGFSVSARAKADADCPRGVVYVHRPFAYGGLACRKDLTPLHGMDKALLPVRLVRSDSPQH